MSRTKLIFALAFVAKLAVAVAVIAVMPGCASRPATFSQQDPQADLHAFKTFAFFAPASMQPGRAGYSTLLGGSPHA